jgi:hypothetical protein
MDLDHPVLHQLLGGLPPSPRSEFTVASIYFPGYHATPYHDSVFGWGWSEWDLVRRCQPRFAGHRQPIEPLWGYYDESDPSWAAQEIDAAADHGIDAWIVDWYWYCGLRLYDEALDHGFLRAPNRSRMKFGLMWANHTWLNNFPAPRSGPSPLLLPIRHSPEDLDRVIDFCTEHYFSQPNYWRIHGKPWFSFFLLSSLIEQFAGESGVGAALERMRKRAQQNGQDDLYLGCFTTSVAEARTCKSVGFDHVATYNFIVSDQYRTGDPFDHYDDLMATHAQRWLDFKAQSLPYWPVVTHGWDVSPRNHPHEPWPPVRWGWPRGQIIQDNTPEKFGQLCQAARRYLTSVTGSPKVMVLNAWNEWTEGSVLAPTRDQGYAVLDALKNALADQH